jgi:hypothetical protein
MTVQEERFMHFLLCIDDLNEARLILREVRSAEVSILKAAAFRFALVKYATPYSSSKGRAVARLKLSEDFVPRDLKWLHSRIIDARHQVHAHTDLNVRNASLHVVDIGGQKIALPIQNIIRGTEELPEVDRIIELIERTLDAMIPESDRLQALLHLSSPSDS